MKKRFHGVKVLELAELELFLYELHKAENKNRPSSGPLSPADLAVAGANALLALAVNNRIKKRRQTQSSII
ncbi:MAG: hypothetical protein P8X90_17765 [Desulfobacterales bacterium]